MNAARLRGVGIRGALITPRTENGSWFPPPGRTRVRSARAAPLRSAETHDVPRCPGLRSACPPAGIHGRERPRRGRGCEYTHGPTPQLGRPKVGSLPSPSVRPVQARPAGARRRRLWPCEDLRRDSGAHVQGARVRIDPLRRLRSPVRTQAVRRSSVVCARETHRLPSSGVLDKCRSRLSAHLLLSRDTALQGDLKSSELFVRADDGDQRDGASHSPKAIQPAPSRRTFPRSWIRAHARVNRRPARL